MIQTITNPIVTNRTKHLNVKIKYLRHLYDSNAFHIKWVPSDDNPADALTKMARRDQFERHRTFMFTAMELLAKKAVRCFKNDE